MSARARDRRWPAAVAAAAVLVVAAGLAVAWTSWRAHAPREDLRHLPLRLVADLPLAGGSSRFDYLSLDPTRDRLYLAHLGADLVSVVDVRRRTVLADVAGVPAPHGVLVVPPLGRVYASATAAHQLVTLDAASYRVLARTPAGQFPDGIAYDPGSGKLFVSDESGGAEVVVDAASGQATGAIALGGEAGNVAVDPGGPGGGQVLVAVQSRDQLAVIDPRSQQVTRRVGLGGCDHDHGLLLDAPHRLAFVACDGNARLLVVDLRGWQVTAIHRVGRAPDVLALDPGLGLVYVASESGTVTVFAEAPTAHGRGLVRRGSGVMPRAHAVAVDPRTHLVYLPLENEGGRPVLRIMAPVMTPANPSGIPSATPAGAAGAGGGS
jgi:DNA-binding beta-propeller fold protein YncE